MLRCGGKSYHGARVALSNICSFSVISRNHSLLHPNMLWTTLNSIIYFQTSNNSHIFAHPSYHSSFTKNAHTQTHLERSVNSIYQLKWHFQVPNVLSSNFLRTLFIGGEFIQSKLHFYLVKYCVVNVDENLRFLFFVCSLTNFVVVLCVMQC